jgi:hypothetical protein
VVKSRRASAKNQREKRRHCGATPLDIDGIDDGQTLAPESSKCAGEFESHAQSYSLEVRRFEI